MGELGVLGIVLVAIVAFTFYAFIGIAIGRYAFHRQPDPACRHSNDLLDGHTFKVAQQYTDVSKGQNVRLSGGRNCDCPLFAAWIGFVWPVVLVAIVLAKLGVVSFKRIGLPFLSILLFTSATSLPRRSRRPRWSLSIIQSSEAGRSSRRSIRTLSYGKMTRKKEADD